MIEHLKHMAIFSCVAEKGSFSEAAKTLGIAPSRVSEAVSKLEHRLGTTLLNRTTRKVALTSEGRMLYAYTSSMVEQAQGGLDVLTVSKSTPTGTLNVSVPSYLTGSPVLEAVGAFSEAHPNVQVAISFTDKHVDPIADGFDMCIRGDGPGDQDDVAKRKLGELERVMVVGQGYYAQRAAPQHPKDLEDWDWVNYRYKKRLFKMTAGRGQRAQISIERQSKIQLDNLDALHFLIKNNAGVAILPLDICRDSIAEGSLVRLFENWRLSKVHYFAVWPEKTKRESLITLFVDFLSDRVCPDRDGIGKSVM